MIMGSAKNNSNYSSLIYLSSLFGRWLLAVHPDDLQVPHGCFFVHRFGENLDLFEFLLTVFLVFSEWDPSNGQQAHFSRG
jgi:hypothetical protein